jgi:hypothetical protein
MGAGAEVQKTVRRDVSTEAIRLTEKKQKSLTNGRL